MDIIASFTPMKKLTQNGAANKNEAEFRLKYNLYV
jgi:hypothetical protein